MAGPVDEPRPCCEPCHRAEDRTWKYVPQDNKGVFAVEALFSNGERRFAARSTQHAAHQELAGESELREQAIPHQINQQEGQFRDELPASETPPRQGRLTMGRGGGMSFTSEKGLDSEG